MDRHTLDALLRDQAGVVARRQVLALGGSTLDLRRLLRGRDLSVIHRGVYVEHTGPPSWLQLAWAAVLATAEFDPRSTQPHGSGLTHESALRVAEGPGRRDAHDRPIHVLVDADRRVVAPAGVVVHRTRHFADRMVASLAPPRTRYEHALLDVASATDDPMDSLGLLARAVGDRRTTAERLLTVSRARSRVPQRAWLEGVLADVADGVCSVLEHGFLTRVVRPHGLPDPRRQVREVTPIGVVYRDAAYGGVLVELDGRLFHTELSGRDADLDRDLFAAVGGRHTIRVGWGQVFARACRTAWALGSILGSADGAPPHPCGPGCPVGEVNVEDSGHQVA